MAKNRYLAILAAVALALITAPYAIGFLSSNNQVQFGGFLINPFDGHSYLAKIQQGFQGQWKFTLPYTADPGEGAYLFLFYLGLGHLNRILQLPGIYIFHIARLISAVWLIFVIGKFFQKLFTTEQELRTGLVLAIFGSGLGWIAVLGGAFTSDFWVAEAFPFLSMYTNPHFSLGLGLMIYLFLPGQEERLLSNLLVGLLLGILQPFAVVIVSLVKVLNGIWNIIDDKLSFHRLLKEKWFWPTIGFCLAGGTVIIYQFWVITTDPVLSLWNQQNITAKPDPFDLLISLSPCLIFGLFGAQKAWKDSTGRTLLLWAGISLVLVFVPWNLQRRFLTGIFFPLSVLSVFGVQFLASKTSLKFRHWAAMILLLAIPTNLIVITSGLQAISEKNPKIFLEDDFVAGVKWLARHSPQEALVLAGEKEGLYIPSLTGRRVIYGHPFETIQAEEEQAFLHEIFYQEQTEDYYRDMLNERGVDYVLLNESQAIDLSDWLRINWTPVFQSNGLTIYSRQVE